MMSGIEEVDDDDDGEDDDCGYRHIQIVIASVMIAMVIVGVEYKT